MTPQEALISLNLIGGIGSLRLKRLLENFCHPQDVLNAPYEKLIAVYGVGCDIAGRITSFNLERLKEELALARKQNLAIITRDDKDYPDNLKNIPDPPLVLYVKGLLREEDKNSIAIVGSRQPSLYGLNCAKAFAGDLSGYGFTVVSGMARGIDTYAHRGALSQGGRTIAVMGSGFGHIYPEENKELAEEISRQGAVISEFAIDEKPLPQHFPQRNRLISGLTKGVLVVEAARNSGALITADFALEQGREVFALPGKVDSRTSFGTNGLIKQGAKLVSCVEDILEEFNLETQPPEIISAGLGLDGDESLLYNSITSQPLSVDEIAEMTHVNISRISAVLLKLEMKKLIRQLPGKQFILRGVFRPGNP